MNTFQRSPRLLSLDVFRGLTIVLMILVNSPGNDTSYRLLEHSVWNGCTLADLAFPFFLFIVGVSLVFSLSKATAKGASFRTLISKIFKRAVIIFSIGLFLNAFPYHFNFDTVRYFGVLQRIAVCYFFAAILFLTTSMRVRLVIMLSLLFGYWLLMTYIPVPGFGAGNLSQEGNLAAYLDRLVFSSVHLYQKIFDPEGFLSTLPALATTLFGTLTGDWLLSKNHTQAHKILGLTSIGLLAACIGWLWGLSFPINKGLWTSTFVLWTGGLALLLLAAFYYIIEIKKITAWSKPLEIFGLNAIAAYFLHIFFLKIQAMIHIPRLNGSPGNLRIYISEHLFSLVSLKNASLLYACSYVVFWLVVLTILYRKKIFIKI